MNKYGENIGFIDELHRRYLRDPESVSEAWREFFEDFRPVGGAAVGHGDGDGHAAPAAARMSEAATADDRAPSSDASDAAEGPDAGQAGSPARKPEPAPAEDALPDDAEPMRGIRQKIVENMEDSLTVPTATSVRTIAVKLLEENRRVINQHQQTMSGPKISFTHLIAWCLVRALERHPEMNAEYRAHDGTPYRIPRSQINLGLAIDMEKKGERILLVPNIKNAGGLRFPEFVAAYNDLVQRARNNELTLDDYADTTVTLTNPGMIGTVMSVPRLMRGQGAILGVGNIDYPAEYSGMAPEMITELGLSKVMTITSTYDHRVIQGAASGQFLSTVEKLVQGEDQTYKRIFADLKVPQEPIRWRADRNPQILGTGGGENVDAIAKQAGVLSLIRAYRVRGSLWADLDPLGYEPEPNPELELSTYGLTAWDLDRKFVAGGLGGTEGLRPLREILDILQRTYCWHVGIEYMHIQDDASRRWIQEHLEDPKNLEAPPREDQVRILRKLNSAEAFENFLGTNYIGQKRFSLEGAETLIPMLDYLFSDAIEAGMEQVVMGMAHRGRLNVLTHMVGKSYAQIFQEFEGQDPESTHGSGDVKYHLGANGVFETDGGELRVTLASNPSHLEAVNPVVEGMARALQDRMGDREHAKVLPLLIHGDAAFSGQGVVAETLQLALLSGYRTGGTVHVVINNQIGFTTRPQDLRSSQYCTDVAKMVRAPIFHVNGDHPEEAVRVIRHALAYRRQFKRDVVVDLVCYRRWGHNEGDDPSYTNPILYAQIEKHRSVRKLYTEQLVRRGDFDLETAEQALEDYRKRLREVHEEVTAAKKSGEVVAWHDEEDRESSNESVSIQPVSLDRLHAVLDGLERRPENFHPHKKLEKQLARRRDRFEKGKIDWALAEALAFGTLVLEGVPVRLSGEDSGRGTFSQRHAAVYDHETSQAYVPLAHLSDDQAPFHVYDSLLSEFAVLGFEYGYSVDHPSALVMWEAQFGDFNNGAQVIIDQFIASAEEKWSQRSSLTMLLPHGYEGQGPEHSSARLERFLQLAAQRNIRVAYPSTPSQYFHLLRTQGHAEERKPLVVMTPKSLLRLPACVSTAEELTDRSWQFLLEDEEVGPDRAKRLILCTGKIYYELEAYRREEKIDDVSIVRVEYLYPVPADSFGALLERYADVSDILWVQEEPRNMGAWGFIQDRLTDLLRPGQTLRYNGRPRGASPATGSAKRHSHQQKKLVARAFEPDGDRPIEAVARDTLTT